MVWPTDLVGLSLYLYRFFVPILSLLVYVADKYVNDQIHLYYDPSSFSLPLYTALKYAINYK